MAIQLVELHEAHVITHAGNFHTGDVMATAFLAMVYASRGISPLKVGRMMNDQVAPENSFLYDVEGCYSTSRLNERSTFGQLWHEFSHEIVDSDVAQEIATVEMVKYDAFDREPKGGKVHFKGSPQVENYSDCNFEVDGFQKAVDRAEWVILRMIEQYVSVKESKQLVIDAQKNNKYFDGKLVVLPKRMPSGATLKVESKAEFVAWPQDNLFSIKALGKKLFPREWGGLRNSDLQQKTGVETAMYCTDACHLLTVKTLEGVFALTNIAIETEAS